MRYKNDNIIKLKIISIWAWISRLINLPMQLYVANCISQIVSLAIVGDTNAVLLNGVILLAVVLVYRIFVVLTDIIYREKYRNLYMNIKFQSTIHFSPTHYMYYVLCIMVT